jgi:Flp pilus assembly protein TadG
MTEIAPKGSTFRRFARCSTATSAVEFAILSPLFLLFIFGMIAYGIYFGASHSIQQIAADAARTAIAGLSEEERVSLATDYIDRNASAYPFVDAGKLTLDISDSSADPSQFTVSLRYDARDLPIWNLLRDLPLPGMTIAQASTIRIGGL